LVKRRLAEKALSVIIARRPCKLIDRERRSMPAYESEKCKTCGLCFGIDCPALVKTDDGHVEINSALCAGCYLCTDICLPGALKKPEKQG
jgi:indolepyruvate ferredoxin oxidoreductase alpha subunit